MKEVTVHPTVLKGIFAGWVISGPYEGLLKYSLENVIMSCNFYE